MSGRGPGSHATVRHGAVVVALVSAGLIAFEIVLMRRLLLECWHHFGFLVISAALLGFGASGTLLAVFARHVRTSPLASLRVFAGGFALCLIVMPRVAALVPLRVRVVPTELWEQAGWWAVYWLVMLVPFLLGAALIGAALMNAGTRAGRIYAANLIGSGA
ncbi:MAG: hypothetical protein JXO22_15100, partial [Phycisphaerae bacterium]|nr:hypothetical protein [Phycisphaerae bacterium]